MAAFPKTRWRDLLGLAARVLVARLRRGDRGEALADWLRGLTRRYQTPNFVIDLIGRRVLFVSGSALSQHVLNAPPSEESFVAGTMKRKAMSFLAPNGLTILHGENWRAFRAYNEKILQPRSAHPHLPLLLTQVEKAFNRPIENIEDTRRRMGQIMLAAVFGEGEAPDRLIADIQELFAEVSLRTALFGSRKGAKLEQFRGELRRLWNSDEENAIPTFLTLARQASSSLSPDHQREELLLDQIPHWMFTFTNSGADLLSRSLAMIISRPASLARVHREIESARPLSNCENHHALQYLEACILETARLFPPVVLTAHRAARGHIFDGMAIEAGMEILQYFPVNNRDVALDPFANYFRPERWLDSDDPVHSRELNIFLSGARACPGRDIILFVVTSAIALRLRDGSQQPKLSLLSNDPLPFSFEERFFQFV